MVAYLIDVLLLVVIYIVGIVVTVAIGVAGFALLLVAVFGYVIWNPIVRQGRTGQTIGKSRRGIKLVRDDNRQPPGAGLALGRLLVALVLSQFTFGIYGLLDYLWPLWDRENKRLTDKMLDLSVIVA